MTFFESFFGIFCKAEDISACCDCKDEPEVLTKAWIDSLEQVSILAEPAVKLRPSRGAPSPSGPSREVSNPALPNERPSAPPASARASAWWNVGQATATSGGLTMLVAPAEFDRIRGGVLQRPLLKGCDASVLGPGAAASAREQRQSLQVCLRTFTRALLRGINVSVLLDDGCTCLAEARMDSELTHLVLHVPNAHHPVALRSIESVSPPEEAWLPQALGLRVGHLDLCCVTLIIEGGQFLTLVFDSSRTREYFEICLKVLILARETAPLSASGSPEHMLERPAVVAPRTGDDGPVPRPELSPETGSGNSLLSDSRSEPDRLEQPPPPPPQEMCADPYVRMTLAGSTEPLFETQVKNDTLDPVWKEDTVVKGFGVTRVLHFHCLDKDPLKSDSLGWARLSGPEMLAEGFNGELKLQESGGALAFLRLKVKTKNHDDYPPGPPPLVTVMIQRNVKELWGLHFDNQDGVHLHIHKVDQQGAAHSYNVATQPECQLKRGDFVVSVNGVVGDAHEQLEIVKDTEQLCLELVVRRPHEFSVKVIKEAGKRGVPGLVLRETPRADCLIVLEVTEEWKPQKHDHPVAPLDRIVAIGKHRGSAKTLLQALKKADGEVDVTLMRPADDDLPC